MIDTSTLTTNDNIADVANALLKQAAAAETSIDINNVTVSFKTPTGIYTAVKDISLSVQKGEIISLIGHSGCGKSTLMGTISGMVKATQGEVIANGKKVTSPGPDRGIVFQNYSLLPWLTDSLS
jgi:nitrate/nitrite transport system ATP-binding protein